MTELENVIARMTQNYDGDPIPPLKVNDTDWTFADLFIRRFLNDGCDGYGLKNVVKVYRFLCKNKQLLIKHNMISKRGVSNFGFVLWTNYDIDNPSKELVRA